MAEALGITSSIIAIIDFSAKIIDYAQAVKGADADQQKLICELQLLKIIVEKLRQRDIKVGGGEVDPLVQATKELEGLLQGLANHLPANANAIGSRLAWPFKHKDIEATFGAIERYKTCILVLNDHQLTEMVASVHQGLSQLSVKIDQRALNTGSNNSPDREWLEVLEWISPLTFYATQADMFAKRTENTGTWLLESMEFKDWVAGRTKCLHGTGIPGAGKSILASVVVDHLEKTMKSQNTAICYIYCNYKQQSEQSALNLISSIIRQLATDYETDEIRGPILKAYKEAKIKKLSLTFSGCIALLREILLCFTSVFIMIDALDECQVEERDKLVTEIMKLSASVSVMSREIPDILELLRDASRIPVRASQEDIDRYLMSEIESNTSLLRFIRNDPTLQQDIIRQISERSQGMFLLVHLHMKAVARHLTIGGIRAELENLPKGDIETYDKAMRLIKEQEPLMSDLGIKVLTWIIYATRPLSLVELQHAVASNVSAENQDLILKETMISACLGLVIYEEIGHRVRLVHYTTQEYFLRKGKSLLSADPHSMLVITCTNHLVAPVRGKLYDYAATNWAVHARETRSTDANAMRSIKDFLAQRYQVSQILNQTYRGYWQEKDCTLLLVGAACGLTHILEAEVLKDVNFGRRKTSKGVGALSLAVRGGYIEAVRLLLKHKGLNVGSDGNRKVRVHQSFLIPRRLGLIAWEGARVFGVGRLAFLNEKDNDGNSALSLAVWEGRLELVSVLLQAGADCNAHNYKGGHTLLNVAALRGDEGIVELLLQAGADCNAQDIHGNTPLSGAADGGHERVVELLLQAGANCDSPNHKGNTPLQMACKPYNIHNALEVVRKLLKAGADPNKPNKKGKYPLDKALKYKSTEVVRLLLKNGVQCLDRTPLNEPYWADLIEELAKEGVSVGK